MLVAGPNLSLDRTIGIDRFDAGHIHRTGPVDARIGGGGANAARVVRELTGAANLISFVPDQNADAATRALADQGIALGRVPCRGEMRVATIVREGRGRMSVLNEPGPAVEAREWEAFERLTDERLPRGELLLCSGSLPPGAPFDGYARLARQARHSGSRCVIDVSGRALAATVEGREGLGVPNLAEAEALLHGPRAEVVHASDDAPDRAQEAANELLRAGAPCAVVTSGASGAAFAEQGPHGRRGWIAAPRVDAINPIGAGDAFAAGLGLRLEGGDSLDNAVSFAVAVAAAHVSSPPGELSADRVVDLAGRKPHVTTPAATDHSK